MVLLTNEQILARLKHVNGHLAMAHGTILHEQQRADWVHGKRSNEETASDNVGQIMAREHIMVALADLSNLACQLYEIENEADKSR